jgi:uncharacterized membrane protein
VKSEAALTREPAAADALSGPVAGTTRLWEVDVARTVAILMMVAYHVGWDVDFLAPQLPIDPFSGGWRALQVATGSSFLFIVGVSLAISQGRSEARGATWWTVYRRHARRAATVIGAALLVSVATFIALGSEDYIRFGILHCIGVSMLIAPLFWRLGPWVALLGVGAIVAGIELRSVEVGTSWLLWLGLRPDTGSAGVDYYPLLPWIGPVLIGLAVGALLYPRGERGRFTRGLRSPPALGILAGWPGRRSLPIYLVHQLILIPLVAIGLLTAGVDLDTDGFS